MNNVEVTVCNPLGSLRRPSRCLTTLLAAVMCGCGARAATSPPTPTSDLPEATPTPAATAAATPTASLSTDACRWLLPSDAAPLLGHAIDTSADGINTDPGLANGLVECSYSTGSLDESVPTPPAIETDALVTILNNTAFAQAQDLTQPDTVSYTVLPIAASTVIPGASSSDVTFFALHVARVAGGNGTFTWTYLYPRVDGNVYFRVGVVDPSGSNAQRRARAEVAALDVLRNLKLSP
jgi:hypothetical protein